MPILKNAKKKLRVDAKRTEVNKQIKTQAKKAIKDLKSKPSSETLQKAFSSLDGAAKHKVFHPRKADRLKSRLSKWFSGLK